MLNDETILTDANEILKVSQIHKAGAPSTPRAARITAERKLTMVNKSLQTILLNCVDDRLTVAPSQEISLIQPLAIAALVGAMAAVGACGAPRTEQVGDNSLNQGTAMNSGSADQPADAPINRRFKSLDDYLAWLRQTQEPVDGPWYEEIRPGIYQLRTGNLRVLGPSGDETPPGQTFTRADLEKKFGFSR